MKSTTHKLQRFLLALFVMMGLIALLSLSLSAFDSKVTSLRDHRDANAGQAMDLCAGLDVVFLIDESNSMAYNDVNLLRSYAVRTAIDMLGDNAIYYCPGVMHRLAVLGFGNQTPEHPAVRSYISSVVISPTLDSLSQWRVFRDQILKPSIPITDSIGATDHIAALKAAATILQRWSAEKLDDTPRRRLVIMVTDGGPCPYVVSSNGGVQCIWGEYKDRNGYLEKLKTLADPVGDLFPWRGSDNPNSVYLWIIRFNDASQSSGYDYLQDKVLYSVWETIAKTHGGEVLTLPKKAQKSLANTELTSFVADILEPLLGSQLEPWDCHKPIWVEPYVNNMAIIHIFRRGANPGVPLNEVRVSIRADLGSKLIDVLERGESQKHNIKVTDYTLDGPNERYVLYFPPPGRYIIQVKGADACKDVDVRIGRRAVRARVLSPKKGQVFPAIEEPPYYDPLAPTTFRIQLLQQKDTGQLVPLVEQPEFPLTVTVHVKGVGKIEGLVDDIYTLVQVDQAKSIYESVEPGTRITAPIKMKYPGYYQWQLEITTPNIRRFDAEHPDFSPITVLTETGTFQVVQVPQFGFKVLAPKEGDILLVSDFESGHQKAVPLDVRIQLIDKKGHPLALRDVLKDPESDTFELSLVDPNGQLLETKRIRPVFSSPILFAQLRNLSNGQADLPGTYQLHVKLLGNYIRDKYRPFMQEETVSFVRTNPQKIDFEIVSPKENELIGLVGDTGKGLPVVVQVFTEDGVPLEAHEFIPNDGSTPFIASLLDAKSNLVETKALELSPDRKRFEARLGEGLLRPECYKLIVELRDNYRQKVFRPRGVRKVRSFCITSVRSFDWNIVEPVTATYPLHPKCKWFPPAKPLSLTVRVQGLDGEPLESSDLLKEYAPLFIGHVSVVGKNTASDIVFQPVTGTSLFLAQWPENLDKAGDYTLEVEMNKDVLSSAFALAGPSVRTREFSRQDSWFTHPWSLLACILFGLIALWDLWLYWLARGSLAGARLIFQDRQSTRSVNLTGLLNRRRYVVKRAQLDKDVPERGLERIEAKASGSNGAEIILYYQADDTDEEGLEYPLDLEFDDDVGEEIEPGVWVRLEKDPRGISSLSLLLMIAPIMVWLIGFGYLHFHS